MCVCLLLHGQRHGVQVFQGSTSKFRVFTVFRASRVRGYKVHRNGTIMIRTTAKMSNDAFPILAFSSREAKVFVFPGVPARVAAQVADVHMVCSLSQPPPLPRRGSPPGPRTSRFLGLGIFLFLVAVPGRGLRLCLGYFPMRGRVAYHPNSQLVSGTNPTGLAVFLLRLKPLDFSRSALFLGTGVLYSYPRALHQFDNPGRAKAFHPGREPSGTFCSAGVDMRLTMYGNLRLI